MVLITDSAEEGGLAAAQLTARAIKNFPGLGLGLAAGNTPAGLYRQLVRLHQSGQIDFSRVRIFSLDEFIGLPSDSPNRFRSFFHRQLLDHVNIDPAHVHLLNPDTGEAVESLCASYERTIQEQGGIDLQILGIGRNGHLGFNEPGSSLCSRTRMTLLSDVTRQANARLFDHGGVPQWAVTMGIGTILEARVLLLLAFGRDKASAVAKALEGPLTVSLPASAIQMHPAAILVLDKKAASRLKNRRYYLTEASQAHVLLPEWLR